MKIRVRIKDIMDMLVLGKYPICLERYELDQKTLMLLKKALVDGRWKLP